MQRVACVSVQPWVCSLRPPPPPSDLSPCSPLPLLRCSAATGDDHCRVACLHRQAPTAAAAAARLHNSSVSEKETQGGWRAHCSGNAAALLLLPRVRCWMDRLDRCSWAMGSPALECLVSGDRDVAMSKHIGLSLSAALTRPRVCCFFACGCFLCVRCFRHCSTLRLPSIAFHSALTLFPHSPSASLSCRPADVHVFARNYFAAMVPPESPPPADDDEEEGAEIAQGGESESAPDHDQQQRQRQASETRQ